MMNRRQLIGATVAGAILPIIPLSIKPDFIQSERRTPIGPYTMSKHIAKLLNHYSFKELSEKSNRSVKWLSNNVNLTLLDPKIGKQVDDGKICVTNAILLSHLQKDEQRLYLNDAKRMKVIEFAKLVKGVIRERKSNTLCSDS